MLRKRRRRAADGLTVTETLTISHDATADELRQFADLFPTGIAGVERIWLPHAPPAGARVPHESLPWYAREILQGIARVRTLVDAANPRTLKSVAHFALHVGVLHGEAFLRFKLGEHARLGVKVQEKNRAASRRRGQDIRANVIARDERVRTEWARLREAHPRAPSHSTHWLAGEIARRLDTPLSTIRSRLTALRLR